MEHRFPSTAYLSPPFWQRYFKAKMNRPALSIFQDISFNPNHIEEYIPMQPLHTMVFDRFCEDPRAGSGSGALKKPRAASAVTKLQPCRTIPAGSSRAGPC